ncbi:MAG: ATP-binding cassette domain-containing protein [Rikenellaceae bacterium]
MQLIEARNIKLGYPTGVIIPHANLTISKGDYIGIIGPNGGGKTTVIKALLGQLTPMSGEIIRAKELKIGYLPQHATLDRKFPISVKEVIYSGSSQKQSTLKEKANELMSMVHIDHLADRVIENLSGGEMQRMLLCRALIDNPTLLILDEPTTYVDSKFEKDFYKIIQELNQHIAIVMVSHDLGTITQQVKSIVCINRGFHHHKSNIITAQQLKMYDCPLQLVGHGDVPHTILRRHQ